MDTTFFYIYKKTKPNDKYNCFYTNIINQKKPLEKSKGFTKLLII